MKRKGTNWLTQGAPAQTRTTPKSLLVRTRSPSGELETPPSKVLRPGWNCPVRLPTASAFRLVLYLCLRKSFASYSLPFVTV